MNVLEIGCGEFPTLEPGWQHLDARELEHIDYVQSATDLSNFEDDSFDMITSKDLIEHISWRDTRTTLKEWLRVAPTVEIETPNAMEAIGQLLIPDMVGLRYKQESNWERFCRTLFGHQDYPENAHLSYFTPQWLSELLIEAGATDVKVLREDSTRFTIRGIR